jgi:ribosome biogenesis GTPase
MTDVDAHPIALEQLGWTPALADAHVPHAALGRVPARVVAEDRGSYHVTSAAGDLRAAVSGRFRFDAEDDPAAFPAVGDWVAIEGGMEDDTVIHALLPRRSALVRQASGRRTEAQVVGANLDVVFVVASLNRDLNLRRLERYVAAAWESGAEPVVLLSKADLATDVEDVLLAVDRVAAGASVLMVSSFDGRGLDEVRARIPAGRTAAFVGSSGVGKSTLLNTLAGEERAAVKEIREDDARGRHTTTHRELILLPSGALILDTPGMRELALWDAEEGVAAAFAETTAEIARLAEGCKFRDCAHGKEPGCAVQAALADGSLDGERWRSFQKLQRELAHEVRKEDPVARQAQRKLWAGRHKAARTWMKAKRAGPDD